MVTLVIELNLKEFNAKQIQEMINTKGLESTARTLTLLQARVSARSDDEINDMMENKKL